MNYYYFTSKKDKRSRFLLVSMSRTCTKCKNSIPDTEQLGVINEKYPTCTKCWLNGKNTK